MLFHFLVDIIITPVVQLVVHGAQKVFPGNLLVIPGFQLVFPGTVHY